MIVVRDLFQLRFGASREAVALWREGAAFIRRSADVRDVRLLTDLTGPYYTLVLESTYDSLATFEGTLRTETGNAEWRAWYTRFVPLVESGRREVFTLVADAP
jgi:hypothetical protein